MERILHLMIAFCFVSACGCGRQGKGQGKGQGKDRAPAAGVASDTVVAVINGLPVKRSDYEAALRAGRVGGSPELVLDEMLSFTLVLNECRAMGESCSGPGPAYARALAFLDRLYPAEKVCGEVTDDDLDKVMAAGREFGGEEGGPRSREAARTLVCEARARKIRRRWVTALRKNAVIEMRAGIEGLKR